ncbi:hypothetical protein IFM89_021880 [Coptis chinensis]|uniref:Uncharacterized protein n=1 Tax=Coptis chinensis TaxID=261450 RepID=A0A835HEQ9_9MAGN|nr:hypothetical protein IFM89_021880 [Coptis chinensis]
MWKKRRGRREPRAQMRHPIGKIVLSLEKNKVVVVLDNHVTTLGPGVSGWKQHNIIFHTASGLCVEDSLRLHSCYEIPAWSYNPQKNIILEGTNFCLQPFRLGLPVDFGTGYQLQ